MQRTKPIIPKTINPSKPKKSKIENLKYFDFNYESEYNESIINFKYHIYYRNIFV